jgi:O-antigen/teichoic acid export membrane protein
MQRIRHLRPERKTGNGKRGAQSAKRILKVGQRIKNELCSQELMRTILQQDSLRGRLARGAFWTTVAALVSRLMAMTVAIVAARILGNARFGELGLVRSTILVFGVLAGSSLGLSCTKYVAEFRDTAPERAGRIIGLMFNVGVICGTLGTLLCLVLASPVAAFVMDARQLADTLRLGCLLVGLNILIGTELGALNGLEAFHGAMLVKSLQGVLNLVFVSIGVWKFGVDGAIGGHVLASVCTLPVAHVVLKRRCRRAGIVVTHRHVLSDAPIIWKFAIPAVLAGVSTQSFEWLARILLSRQPDGFAQVGVVTAALSLALLVQFLPQQVALPMMPILSNVYSSGQRELFRRTIRQSSVLLIAVGLAVAIPMVFLARNLMTMYGASFASGVAVLVILCLTYGLMSVTMVFTNALAAAGRMWTQTGHKLAWGVTMAVSMYVLVGHGALGMAYAYAAANLVYGMLQFVTVTRLVRKMGNERQSSALSHFISQRRVAQVGNP